MKVPKIAIVTPAYNSLPYIKKCIDSVLLQDFEDWELVISDDCSTDDTVDYLKTIVDPRIKIFYQEKNLGIFGNLNFAFTKVTAPISQLLCTDDYFYTKEALAILVEYWKQANQEIGFCRFNFKGAFQKKVIPPIVKYSDAELLFFSFGNIPGNLSNVSLRTDIVKEIGWFNPDLPYAGDFDFWVRASRIYNMGIESEVITYVRRHPNVASNYLNKNGEIIAQLFTIVQEMYTNLLLKYPEYRFNLKMVATNYDVLHRDTAIRLFLKGNRKYYQSLTKEVNKVTFLFAKPLIWLMFIVSFGGRLFLTTPSKILLKKVKFI
jgi:glycosyltransferase involved in cell wall biosynthesis